MWPPERAASGVLQALPPGAGLGTGALVRLGTPTRAGEGGRCCQSKMGPHSNTWQLGNSSVSRKQCNRPLQPRDIRQMLLFCKYVSGF